MGCLAMTPKTFAAGIDGGRRFLDIVEELPFPTFAIDGEHHVTLWNKACARLTGIPAETMLCTDQAWTAFYKAHRPTMADLIVDGTLDARIDELYPGKATRCCENEGWEIEDFFPDLPGGERWLAFTAVALRDDDGKVVGALQTIHDLTAHRQVELAHREMEHRLAQIIENSPVPMFVIDNQHRVTNWNRACEAIVGVPAETILGTRDAWKAAYSAPRPVLANLMVDGIDPAEIAARYDGKCRPSTVVPGAWEATDYFEARQMWFHFTASPLRALDGSVVGAVQAFRDITVHVRHRNELEHRTTHDALTGLPNRELAIDRLDQAVKSADRTGKLATLLFIDLDGFKFVNDTLGHHNGDELLKQVATRLTHSCLRVVDTLARLGGDEFIVILPEQTNREDIAAVAARIVATLEQPFFLQGREIHISASIGIAIFPEDAGDVHALLRHADAAMYRAKESGKGNFQFYTGSLNRQAAERLAIKNGLAKALERREFQVLYQPKSDVTTGRLIGMEALLRWNSPTLGRVTPDKFIPVLEETGLIVAVGEWVLTEACRQLCAWHRDGHRGLRMAVNVSLRQLWHANFAERVEQILASFGLDPSCLELELTESMIMREADHTLGLLRRLTDIGVHLAMDDFGTGYSSLSYLKRFPIKTIKIDRSFIKDLATDPDDLEIVRTIITMGRSLRRHIVAEGVETEEQRAILRALRCDAMQGYLLSEPLSDEEMRQFLVAAAQN